MSDALAISVRGLKKSFKNIQVLKGVNLSVQKGTIFALLGPNGAGKTTTIKILTTLLQPDSGKAEVGGYDVMQTPKKIRKIISLTGQYAAVDEILTGRENMYLIGRLRHLSNIKAHSDHLLEEFDLTYAADRYTSTYSGGMRRRLDLAMTLLGDPQIVFLDEPTTGLDPQARAEMWKIIKELTKSGVTVFLTTQYLDEADQLADYIAILHKGKITAEGTSAQLKKLLPQGHLEVQFKDEADLAQAAELLSISPAYQDEVHLTLPVATDGTPKEMLSLFSKLEAEGIYAVEFTQKSPTLDDVFMSIIREDA